MSATKLAQCPRRHLLPLVAALLLAVNAAAGERVTVNFNPDWRFIKDDPAGAHAPPVTCLGSSDH